MKFDFFVLYCFVYTMDLREKFLVYVFNGKDKIVIVFRNYNHYVSCIPSWRAKDTSILYYFDESRGFNILWCRCIFHPKIYQIELCRQVDEIIDKGFDNTFAYVYKNQKKWLNRSLCSITKQQL